MKLNQSNCSAIIRLWINVMKRLRISPQAIARTLLSNLDNQKPLTKSEAVMIQLALEKSGVKDANSRLVAGFARLILKQVA